MSPLSPPPHSLLRLQVSPSALPASHFRTFLFVCAVPYDLPCVCVFFETLCVCVCAVARSPFPRVLSLDHHCACALLPPVCDVPPSFPVVVSRMHTLKAAPPC